MPKCAHSEIWTLTDLPQGIFASRLRTSAIDYHRAAERLFGDDLHKSPPAYFCAAHAIELALKSYLAAFGVGRADMRNKLNHCLVCMYERAQELGLAPDGQDYSGVMHHLREYTVLHRYPDFQMQQVITPGDVLSTSATLLLATESKVMDALLNDAGRKGTYNVDIFSHGIDKADLGL